VIRLGRAPSEIVKVVATEDATEVFLNGVSQGTIDEGKIWQNNFPASASDTTIGLSTSNPSYVFHQSGIVAGKDENGMSQISPIGPNGLAVARFKVPSTGAEYFLVSPTSAVGTLEFFSINPATDTSTPISPTLTTELVPGNPDFSLVTFTRPANQEVLIQSGARVQIGQLASSGSGGGYSYIAGFEKSAINAQDDTYYGSTDTAVVITPLGNDTTASSSAITISSFAQPDNGTVIQTAPETLLYTPDPGFNGTDTFQYTVIDGDRFASAANITVDIQPRPTARVVVTVDLDGDLVAEAFDVDDDNDGILDVYENADTDSDTTVDSVDLDSDNDGISDFFESGISDSVAAIDANADGSISRAEAAAAISTVTINSVNINDSSTANSVVRVKLAIDNAAITLAQISNLTIIGGADGSGFVFVEGLESDVNAALAGMTVTAGAGYSDADQLMVTTYASGIEGQFTFDAATAVNDAGSDSHDGTLEDGAIFFSDIEQGEVVELDGNDDAIFINSRFNDPTSTTVSGWVNLNSANGELINIGGVIALRVDETENGIAGYYWDGTQYITTTSGEFIAGTGWRHVAYTIDAAADTQTLYLDGVAVGSSTFASDPTYNLPAAFTHSTIGRHADPANNAFDLDEYGIRF